MTKEGNQEIIPTFQLGLDRVKDDSKCIVCVTNTLTNSIISAWCALFQVFLDSFARNELGNG